MSTTKPDDLQAVRDLVDALQPFDDIERDRIIRWAREKLGMGVPASIGAPSVGAPTLEAASSSGGAPPSLEAAQDISSFIAKKDPKSDVHFAAAVAYYYQFLAPASERKAAITREDLIDACRKATRRRPKTPAQVLVNAYHQGFLDRGERGQYRLNSVGENLVAMVLPSDGSASSSSTTSTRGSSPRKSSAAKKKSGRGKRA